MMTRVLLDLGAVRPLARQLFAEPLLRVRRTERRSRRLGNITMREFEAAA